MEDKLTDIEGAGEGTVLEMKEERGLGKTLDVILYRGSVKKGDEIVLVTDEGGVSTHVRGMFAPRGMSEMRDAGNRWDDTESAHAVAHRCDEAKMCVARATHFQANTATSVLVQMTLHQSASRAGVM